MARPHKYIRRLGAPKQYHYVYREPYADKKLREAKEGAYEAYKKLEGKLTGKTFKMEVEEASKVLRDLEAQGKKGTEEWQNAVEDWKDALDEAKPKGKTFKMEQPFDVPVLPMSRRAKKFVIADIDRKLGIRPSAGKLEAEMESKWTKVPRELQYAPWQKPPKGTEDYRKLMDWKDAKVRYERAKEGEDFREGKTFKMEGMEHVKNEFDFYKQHNPKFKKEVSGKKLVGGYEFRNWNNDQCISFSLMGTSPMDMDHINLNLRTGEVWRDDDKTFKMEEAPRHIILEGGPNRRLKPEEKAKFFKQDMEHSAPAYLKPQVKTNINNSLFSIGTYHDAIPLDKIFDVLKAHGIVPLQEDNTEWSGLLIGREGQMYLPIAPFGSRSPEKEFEHTYKPFKNAKLSISWYTMPSGRYEVGAHVG
jgi:hypothetical protein